MYPISRYTVPISSTFYCNWDLTWGTACKFINNDVQINVNTPKLGNYHSTEKHLEHIQATFQSHAAEPLPAAAWLPQASFGWFGWLGWLGWLRGEDQHGPKEAHGYGKPQSLMGKSTISMAIFNSKLLVYQRVATPAQILTFRPRNRFDMINPQPPSLPIK